MCFLTYGQFLFWFLFVFLVFSPVCLEFSCEYQCLERLILRNKLPFVEQDVKTLHTQLLYSHAILFFHLTTAVSLKSDTFPTGIFKQKCEDQDREFVNCVFACCVCIAVM